MIRTHLSNSAYGMLDYAAQPLAMLVAAPVLLHHLGIASYGLWLIASAAVGAGSIVSSGFGDAVIQRIALLRATDDLSEIRRVIGTTLAINLALGFVLAGLLLLLVPYATFRIAHGDTALLPTSRWSLRLGAVLILIKSVESVFISTQRAYERYAPAVRIAIATRLCSIVVCLALVLTGRGVIALMIATLSLSVLGAAVQGLALGRHLGPGLFRPAFHPETARQLASVGGFTWLQAVSGILFSQADRLILGALLGASAVAYYGVTVQLAQPIHGLTAAGLHFLFPHLAARTPAGPDASLRKPVALAFLVNALAAFTLIATVLLLGPRTLALWMGTAFAQQTHALLPTIALGFGLLALNITAHYTLMAVGRVRLVTAVNLAGGLTMLLLMVLLVPHQGAQGAALARLCYGPVTLLLYLPLLRLIRGPFVPQVTATFLEMEQA